MYEHDGWDLEFVISFKFLGTYLRPSMTKVVGRPMDNIDVFWARSDRLILSLCGLIYSHKLF